MLTLMIGSLLLFIKRDPNDSLSKRDGFLIIALAWVVVPLFGSLPFLFTDAIHNPLDAVFESISGFATNGLSVVDADTSLGFGLIFWRSIIQWIGGIGIIVFIISFIPFFRTGQAQVFLYDMQDSSFDKLHPTVSGTARRLISIYTATSLIMFALLILIAKMDWFNAACYTFSTISTGGFSLDQGNISALSHSSIWIIALFMFVAGTNLYFVYYILKINIRKVLDNEEFKWYAMIILLPVFLIVSETFYRINSFNFSILGDIVFNVISVISTTGFYIGDAEFVASSFWWITIFCLMFLGSTAASSSGGINVYRQIVLWRASVNYFKSVLHPNGIFPTKLNGKVVPDPMQLRIMGFFILFLLVFVIGAFIISLNGLGFQESLSLSVCALSNNGNAIHLLSSAFDANAMHWGNKLVVMMLMIIGRLEIIPFMMILSRTFWRR